jgi:hypothetical protein
MVEPARSPTRFLRVWQIAAIALTLLLTGILTIAALNNGTLWVQQPPMTEISTITLDIHYEGNRSGYLGPVEQDECSQCPIRLEEGTQASFTILRLSISTSGPSVVYITWTINSTYPFEEVGYLLPNPPVVTSQTTYNVSYLAGSSTFIFPTFVIPSAANHPPSVGNVTTTIVASPSWLPNS